jgi:hypothetical protein
VVRLTVDEAMVIRGCEAVSDHTPYDVCPQAARISPRWRGW